MVGIDWFRVLCITQKWHGLSRVCLLFIMMGDYFNVVMCDLTPQVEFGAK